MKSASSFAVARRGSAPEAPAVLRPRMDASDVLVDARSEPPVAIRRSGDRILLAATAAGPVGGDHLHLDAAIGAAARADIGSVGALLVWPGPDGAPSRATTSVTVGRAAHLVWRPEPTISVRGSRHRTTMTVDLDDLATCAVVEEVALGRAGEPSGDLELAMRVTRAGRPLVHHGERFGPDVPGAGSSVSVADGRHVLMAVVVGSDAGRSVAQLAGPVAVARFRVADDVAVVTAVARTRPEVLRAVAQLEPELITGR